MTHELFWPSLDVITRHIPCMLRTCTEYWLDHYNQLLHHHNFSAKNLEPLLQLVSLYKLIDPPELVYDYYLMQTTDRDPDLTKYLKQSYCSKLIL
jgi:hypothetical protein